MVESVPTASRIALPSSGPGSTPESRQADFCLNRCVWRQLYETEAEKSADFSTDDCSEAVELAGDRLNGLINKCGLAALSVAFSAQRREF